MLRTRRAEARRRGGSPTPRLIVNADDFGFTRDVNEGIVEAHRNGILTATTLMANGTAFDHAVALAKANPSLDVGCHLVFVQEPGLPATLPELIWAVARRDLDLYAEASAQVRTLIAAGVHPTHIDTHKHTHLMPQVMNALTRVAREFKIPWVRQIRAYLRRAPVGLRVTDHFTGFRLTGTLDRASLVETLDRLPEGLTELMCHPGKLGAELRNAKTRLKETRALELAALTSPEARDAVARNGIELTNYLGEIRLLIRP